MTFHDTGGHAPAYRLAPDIPTEIGTDLGRLIAGSTGNVPHQAPLPPLNVAISRRRTLFGSMTLAEIADEMRRRSA